MPTGWIGSTRRQRLPKDWPKIRAAVLTRDGHRCQHIREDTGLKCGRLATDVDHIVQGIDDDRPAALQSLCSWHHLRKSSSEGGNASARARRTRADAAKPKHPGLLGVAPPLSPTPRPSPLRVLLLALRVVGLGAFFWGFRGLLVNE